MPRVEVRRVSSKVHLPEAELDNAAVTIAELSREAEKHEIGVLRRSRADDYKTWGFLQAADRNDPATLASSAGAGQRCASLPGNCGRS